MKKILVSLSALVFMLSMVGISFAAPDWYTCSIVRIGAAGADSNLVKVGSCDKTAANNVWLEIVNQKDVEMAVLLTALSLGKKVKFNTDLADGNTYHQVITIYLDN